METQKDSLLGRPFLRSQIDWAEEYKKHLAEPNPNPNFEPKEGISICECRWCFYHDGPADRRDDCLHGYASPKKFFGIPVSEIMPQQIEGKEVGNYCPYYLDWKAN